MSTTLEQKSGSPWRKRSREDLESVEVDLKEIKRPRYYYYRLESESSKTSEDDTESVWSLQDKETDVVRDTSDTASQADSDQDGYEVEFEYEVASLSDGDMNGIEISSSDSDDMMLAAAAAVICDSSLEAWATDGEESDSSSDDASFGRTDFSTCVQCKCENDNPHYRYCEKCFQSCRQCKMHKTYKCFPLCQSCYQDRKKFFPPRPRRNRRKKVAAENPVKLDTLRSCLNGLSQDSGIGSSQECPSLGLDQIVVPEYLQTPGMSKSEDKTIPKSKSLGKTEDIQSDSDKSKTVDHLSTVESGKESNYKRKRENSESSLSDFDVKKPKIKNKLEQTSDVGSEINSISSFSSNVTEKSSFSSETSGFVSEKEKSVTSLEKSNSFGSDKSESELCMFCNNAPKDSIFLHTNIAHRCCCYRCAKKTLKTIKRCPICNRSVNKVVRIYTS